MTDTYKKTRKETATDLLHSYDTGDEGSLSQIITGDETRIQAAAEGMAPYASPKEEELKSAPSAGRMMVTVFSDDKGVILLNVLPTGTTVNFDTYTETLRRMNVRHSRGRRTRKMNCAPHDKTDLHISTRPTVAITNFGYTVLPLLPYSPYLAPPDCHLFGL